MNEEDLRDVCAMFALCGLVMRGGVSDDVCTIAYRLADGMLEARKAEEDGGIVSIKKRKYERKSKE